MNDSKIQLANRGKTKNGNAILKDINLKFTSWKRYILLGPSGTGKTTLLLFTLNPCYHRGIAVEECHMVVILFGVAGSGKTTIGRLLSNELGWKFYDADDFHPTDNIEKMKQAIPLSDEDRRPWLERLRELIKTSLAKGVNAVLACSALKEAHRQYLRIDDEVRFVFLKGEFSLIQERLRNRRGHFMNLALLRSQFDTLEEPKGVVVVDVTSSPSMIVQTIRSSLGI